MYSDSQIMQITSNANSSSSAITANPQTMHSALFSRYCSSQSYFFSNITSQIIKQKCTPVRINFEDIECWLDEQQFLKREYRESEHINKMEAFKEYYFYHEDCPRIFGDTHIAEVYQRWHEKKRDLTYRKLKIIYNQSDNSDDSSLRSDENAGNLGDPITHFLMEISDYNPYSKKYYLRVKAKQNKEKHKETQKKNERSDLLYQKLKSQISYMINNVSKDLSQITNLNSTTFVQKTIQNQENFESVKSRQMFPDAKSTNNEIKHIEIPFKTVNNIYQSKDSAIKLSFTKKTRHESIQVKRNRYQTDQNAKVVTTNSPPKQQPNSKYNLKNNVKLGSIKIQNVPILQKKSKIQSILLMSSLSKAPEIHTQICTTNNIMFGNKIYKSISQKQTKNEYNSEKNKIQSPKKSLNQLKGIKNESCLKDYNRFASQQKLKNTNIVPIIKHSSTQKLLKLPESLKGAQIQGLKLRQQSLNKIGWPSKNNIEQFSDKKIAMILPSYNSEYSTSASTKVMPGLYPTQQNIKIKLTKNNNLRQSLQKIENKVTGNTKFERKQLRINLRDKIFNNNK